MCIVCDITCSQYSISYTALHPHTIISFGIHSLPIPILSLSLPTISISLSLSLSHSLSLSISLSISHTHTQVYRVYLTPILMKSPPTHTGSLEKYLRLNRDTMYNSPSTMLDFSVQVTTAICMCVCVCMCEHGIIELPVCVIIIFSYS